MTTRSMASAVLPFFVSAIELVHVCMSVYAMSSLNIYQSLCCSISHGHRLIQKSWVPCSMIIIHNLELYIHVAAWVCTFVWSI